METVFSKSLYSGVDLFASAGLNSSITLNPSLTLGSGGGAGVVVVAAVVVVGVVLVVVVVVAAFVGGADGKVIKGELALPKNKNVNKLIHQVHLMLFSNTHGILGKLSNV